MTNTNSTIQAIKNSSKLSAGEKEAMLSLAMFGKPVTTKDIASTITKYQVSLYEILRKLEKKGFVEKTKIKTTKRVFFALNEISVANLTKEYQQKAEIKQAMDELKEIL